MVADAADNQETKALKSKNLMLEDENGRGKYSKHNYKAFTERGLYMLATILKGDQAVETTLTIVDTFAKLHELKRTIAQMAQSPDEYQQKSLMHKGGEIIDDLFGDNFSTNETETEIELNFAVLKLRHTIKRKNQQ
jgi:phage regulator Rha-like protein